MNLEIVTLEITTLIIAFDHYDSILSEWNVTDNDANDAYQKISAKGKQHLDRLFGDHAFFDDQRKLIPLPELKKKVKSTLADIDINEVHEFIERMEKVNKKLKKFYRSKMQ